MYPVAVFLGQPNTPPNISPFIKIASSSLSYLLPLSTVPWSSIRNEYRNTEFNGRFSKCACREKLWTFALAKTKLERDLLLLPSSPTAQRRRAVCRLTWYVCMIEWVEPWCSSIALDLVVVSERRIRTVLAFPHHRLSAFLIMGVKGGWLPNPSSTQNHPCRPRRVVQTRVTQTARRHRFMISPRIVHFAEVCKYAHVCQQCWAARCELGEYHEWI